ncbi:unnamed protein product [Didymodactylos carnosus]|uniref:Uncharacterized protein n=1 Tax=Didymodactylos carnosus TaxID=1234261 RepID=A0A815XLU2_9BILA|nr:unnamed protein product [Didymodactylos carnosus]CAF4420931.1 unnamed protein product [Didymodactylos carnosus]
MQILDPCICSINTVFDQLLKEVKSLKIFSHQQASMMMLRAGIQITSVEGCSKKSGSSCTSLEAVRSNTLKCILILKKYCECPIRIVGGTEINSLTSKQDIISQINGYKLKIRLNSGFTNYIYTRCVRINETTNGYKYKSKTSRNIYMQEVDLGYWDITFESTCI